MHWDFSIIALLEYFAESFYDWVLGVDILKVISCLAMYSLKLCLRAVLLFMQIMVTLKPYYYLMILQYLIIIWGREDF